MKKRLANTLGGRLPLIGLIGSIALASYSYNLPRNISPQSLTAQRTSQPTTQPSSLNQYQTDSFDNDSDKVLLARMLYGETGGRLPLEETVAIANTAIRRSKDGKKWNGETLHDSILSPRQYSCFNTEDPQLPRLKNPYANDKECFDRCLEIADGVLTGKYKDTSKGATHYYNPEICSPPWAKSMQRIGYLNTSEGKCTHIFCIEKTKYKHSTVSKIQVNKSKQKPVSKKKMVQYKRK